MASPQTENGFTRIANELLEALCRVNIPASELRIMLFIMRRTYGFNRPSAEISLSEIGKAVGMRTAHVSRSLKKLRDSGMIEMTANSGIRPQILSIVKDYEKWSYGVSGESQLPDMVTVTATGNTGLTDSGNMSVTNGGNTAVTGEGNHTYKEIKERYKESKKESAAAKRQYGCTGRVLLTEEEHDSLVRDYGRDNTDRYISRMDNWLRSRNARISDCCKELRSWLEKDSVRKPETDYNAKYGCFANDFDRFFAELERHKAEAEREGLL